MITPPRRNNFMINLTKKEKGFTLIELMIVVAIIGILAAIAIPQFSNYRTKAFNAAAVSDLHTARLAEEALFADYQAYGGSVIASGGAGAAEVVTSAGFVALGTNTTTLLQQAPITVSNNVGVTAKVTGGIAAMTAKHTSGDKYYAAQTDLSGNYQKAGAVATAASTTDAITASAGTVPTGYTIM